MSANDRAGWANDRTPRTMAFVQRESRLRAARVLDEHDLPELFGDVLGCDRRWLRHARADCEDENERGTGHPRMVSKAATFDLE